MRFRPLLPLLLSTIPLPVVAADYSVCVTATDSVSCIIEQAEFARQRNAEIDASIARVERARAHELALSLTHCKSHFSRTPRCLAERSQRFASRQNELAAASIARVAEARAFAAARNAEIVASIAAVEAERTRRLEVQQKALIEASIAATNAERQRRFAAYQNNLATASIERVAAERHTQLAISLSPCTSEADTRPRCEAQRAREFAAQQNALATASVERVQAERERAFAAARNAEADASIAAVERARASGEFSRMETAALREPANTAAETQQPTISAEEYAALTSHCVRAPESPRCEAEHIREFAAARNAEIERSLAAVAQARAAGGNDKQGMSGEEYAALTSHCVRAPESPRCEAEHIREFAAARNAEIERSLVAVERDRARRTGVTLIPAAGHPASFCGFAPFSPVCRTRSGAELALSECRSVGYSSSGCDYAAPRAGDVASAAVTSAAEYAAYTSQCVRNPESPRCEAERIREFAAARNAEIERSLAAVAAARANGELGNTFANTNRNSDTAPLETGAIGTPSLGKMPAWHGEPENELRHDISTDPCRSEPFDAVEFVRGTEIHAGVKPELDRLAKLALACPGVRIEVHGFTDGGSPFNNRNLAQARAQAIADYLVAAGIASNRVAAIGLGGRHPVMLYGKSFAPANGRAELVIRDPNTDAAARRVMWDLAELLDPTYIPAVANLSP